MFLNRRPGSGPMEDMKKDPDSISQNLLFFLKSELDNQGIGFKTPLTQVQGGYETLTYRFTLHGVDQELAKPLILRLYPPHLGTVGAGYESALQNVLADQGYPIAKSHFLCTDTTVLGGAFFIMDFLPGESLMSAGPEIIPELLGKTHARLHEIDPDIITRVISEKGIDANRYSFARQYDLFDGKGKKFPWIREGLEWLAANRPPEPKQLAVCHGDFHPLNILIDKGKISGVIDWPNFNIGDPAHDVANTLMLMTIPGKYSPDLAKLSIEVNFNEIVDRYLSAYRARKELDMRHLDYFQAKRCLKALIEGAEGQAVWQHPPIREELIDYIYKTAGIRVKVPSNPE